MARLKTKYIVVHCSQTRPSQKIGAKEIDRWHRERGWLKIGYARVIKRDGTIEQGRADDELQAHVKNYNHIYIIYNFFYNSVFPVLSKFVARLAMKRLNPFSSLTSTTSSTCR